MALLHWTGGAHREPLAVYGPPGVEELVAGFNLAYRQDAAYRTAHHGPEVVPPSGAGSRAVPFPAPEPGHPRVVWRADEVEIVAFAVDHAPVSPAIGYRFDYGGRSLIISGDTSRSAELERMSRGVDLLAHEALSPRLMGIVNDTARTAGQINLADIAHDVLNYHASPVEAAATATAAGARHLLFYHVVPPLPLPGLGAAFLEGVSDAYRGPVTLSRDGTFVSLPTGTSDIRVSRRL
jgi:ribonuclease Z